MCSSYWVFLLLTNWLSSLQEGKETQVSLRTSLQIPTWPRPEHFGWTKLRGRAQ